jgi:hypothetical protein
MEVKKEEIGGEFWNTQIKYLNDRDSTTEVGLATATKFSDVY